MLLIPAGIIIFPFGWLANSWPGFGFAFNGLFQSEAAHIIAHSLLFAMVGLTALAVAPRIFGYWPLYLLFILSLGLLQEGLQYATFIHIFQFNALFDLAVDMGAAGVVFGAKKLFTPIPTRF